MSYVQKLFSEIGLESERVHMFNMSAAMAGEFARAASEMARRIETLGPNRLRDTGENQAG